jgi:hypothetical protein
MVLRHSRVVNPDRGVGTILTPPLNDFLQKRIFRPGCKEVTVEIPGLSIKKDKNRHGRRLWEKWCVHDR